MKSKFKAPLTKPKPTKELTKLEDNPTEALFAELKRIVTSEEFDIGLQLALRKFDARHPINETYHLYLHSQTSRLAVRDFIDLLRHTFYYPSKATKEEENESDFAE